MPILKTQVNSILPSKSFIWQTMLSLQQADLSLWWAGRRFLDPWRSLGISVFWLILLAEIFCFSTLWRNPGSNSPAMFAHDRKLPGVHTDQVKLLQDMGFPADSSFKIQWVDDLFSIISQHQAGGINVCVLQNDMPSIGGYIEDTLILRSCHTTGFLQTCWGKKTTVEFMIVPTPCDLCKRCVWEHVEIRLRVWIQHQWFHAFVSCCLSYNVAHVRKSCRLVCPGCSLHVLPKMLVLTG